MICPDEDTIPLGNWAEDDKIPLGNCADEDITPLVDIKLPVNEPLNEPV